MHWEHFQLILGCLLPLRALVIPPCLSFPPPSLLMPFFYSCSTRIATTKTVKMATRHLDGQLGVEIFVRSLWFPDLLFWADQGASVSCNVCCWQIFFVQLRVHFFNFLYMERQILALGYSTWPMEVSQVGWISTCVDWRVILALQEPKFSFLASFLFLQSSHHLNKNGGSHVGNLQNHRLIFDLEGRQSWEVSWPWGCTLGFAFYLSPSCVCIPREMSLVLIGKSVLKHQCSAPLVVVLAE